MHAIERWWRDAVAARTIIGASTVQEGLIAPLIKQVQIDGGEILAQLAQSRLAVKPAVAKLRSMALAEEVTPARLYQRLEDIGTILRLRWPGGQVRLAELRERLMHVGGDSTAIELLSATIGLMIADWRRKRC
jgi:hypothetical protein